MQSRFASICEILSLFRFWCDGVPPPYHFITEILVILHNSSPPFLMYILVTKIDVAWAEVHNKGGNHCQIPVKVVTNFQQRTTSGTPLRDFAKSETEVNFAPKSRFLHGPSTRRVNKVAHLKCNQDDCVILVTVPIQRNSSLPCHGGEERWMSHDSNAMTSGSGACAQKTTKSRIIRLAFVQMVTWRRKEKTKLTGEMLYFVCQRSMYTPLNAPPPPHTSMIKRSFLTQIDNNDTKGSAFCWYALTWKLNQDRDLNSKGDVTERKGGNVVDTRNRDRIPPSRKHEGTKTRAWHTETHLSSFVFAFWGTESFQIVLSPWNKEKRSFSGQNLNTLLDLTIKNNLWPSATITSRW